MLDAADLDHLIDILCNPDLYRAHFHEPLSETFPLGREQARCVLIRLVEPRNALAHAGPLAVRQAEQIICYSSDVIDALKGHYATKNMEKEFNVPTIIRYSDSRGNVLHREQFLQMGSMMLAQPSGKPLATVRVGERLSIEVEIDPTFARAEYSIDWIGSTTGMLCPDRTQLLLDIDFRHVNEQFGFHATVKSKEAWHRFGTWDDCLIATYRILPA
ncbi:hypothetical protein RLW55_12335 [Hyphomicrobium sp. B1]|uniref:hypothetical protein n=1 Tax=Hyphomicrobium sp. B1 TaxID=3075651 RepID=UPI003C2DCC23